MSKKDPYINLYYRVVRQIARFVKFIRGGKTYGLENVPKEGPVLIISNHNAAVDPLLTIPVFPYHVTYVGKAGLRDNAIFNWFSRNMNAILLEDDKQELAALRGMLNRLKEGDSIFLYPEGHRYNTGKVEPFQNGAAFLAIRAGVPIVPLAVRDMHYLFIPGKHKIQVRIGKPIILEEGLRPTKENMDMVSEQLRAAVQELVDQCYGEGESPRIEAAPSETSQIDK